MTLQHRQIRIPLADMYQLSTQQAKNSHQQHRKQCKNSSASRVRRVPLTEAQINPVLHTHRNIYHNGRSKDVRANQDVKKRHRQKQD